ncbi:DUF421 domain-containing protein [Sphingomonas xanthus]|uniref:DUF421 domain-containing protein n=2 Tax=Sphingomonas xanthus TaxID=2594473 RepID=A0A516IUC9_9SPHN|nr:DUF421 domain-containing protein [Sphingomonas xanthus]
MFFEDYYSLLRVTVVTLVAYISLVAVVRFAGKRALAKLSAFDLIVTIAFGSTLATVLLSKDVAFLEGLLAFVLLAGLQWAVAKLSMQFSTIRKFIRSDPALLVENGQYRLETMASERINKAEVDQAIRSQGIGSLADVRAVVLEPDGSLSVLTGDGPCDLLSDVVRRPG